jgi:hypothetical protein
MAGDKFGALKDMEDREQKERTKAIEDPSHNRYAQDRDAASLIS